MNTVAHHRVAGARWLRLARIAPLALMLSACAVGPGGYGGGYGYDGGPDVSVGFGADYYAPYGGFDYGGWGPGYHSGPWRGGDRGFHGGGRGGSHPWRSPGAGRGVPSIPSAGHGLGGWHGGGGGGHGGGGHR